MFSIYIDFSPLLDNLNFIAIKPGRMVFPFEHVFECVFERMYVCESVCVYVIECVNVNLYKGCLCVCMCVCVNVCVCASLSV